MEVVGLMMVRNEADILRLNVLHHLAQGIDRFLIVDNGSIDGTDRVLRELARGGRVRWTRDDGPYRQAEITTELAREAQRGGADWVVPIDADEFWYAPGGNFRRVLTESTAGALEVQLVNFIQRRDQINTSAAALLQMTRRAPQAIGPIERAVELIETCQISFVEHAYAPKWISRSGPTLEILTGNHSVSGVTGSTGSTEEIVCLHAPLRARAHLEARMVDHSRRASELGDEGKVWWNARRWGSLAENLGLTRALEREWAANSYADDCLDVYGVRHPLVFDTRLRDVLRPWVKRARPEYPGITLKEPSAPSIASCELGARPAGAAGSILARMSGIEGWLFEAEASLLMTTTTLALAGRQPHAVVEIGSYCGRSTVVLGSVVQAICPTGKVFAIDPHQGQLSLPGGESRADLPTLERFRGNIEGAGLTSVVETIQKESVEVAWDRPISVLFIDGLHDYLSVSRDVDHFGPWVVDGGYVVFDDYDSIAFPGVVACVSNLLDSGRYRKFRRIGRMMVVQKQSSSVTEEECAPSDFETCNPTTTVVRAILEEGIGPLQVALDELTEWAEGMEQESARREAIIEELQQALAARGAVIEEFQQALGERTAWAERMVAEAEQRGAIIEELRQALAERTAWPERMAAQVRHLGEIITWGRGSLLRRRLRRLAAWGYHTVSRRG